MFLLKMNARMNESFTDKNESCPMFALTLFNPESLVISIVDFICEDNPNTIILKYITVKL